MSGGSPQLVPGAIQGVRSWDLVPETGTGRVLLSSLVMSAIWPRGVVSAECLGQSHQGAAPMPGPDCDCGIYAFHPSEVGHALVMENEAVEGVTGVIEAWGRVEVHAAGIRAEHARVKALFVDADASVAHHGLVRAATETYGAELVVVSETSFDPWLRQNAPGLDEAFVEELLVRERDLHFEPRSIAYMSRRGEAVGGFGFVEIDESVHPKRFQQSFRVGSLLAEVVRVAGAQHRPDALQAEEFAPGRELRLVPEPDNPHDSDAIAVWDAEEQLKVGYIPRALAPDIKGRLAAGRIGCVHSAWQWRDMRSGVRTGLHVLVSRTKSVTFEGAEQLELA